jgi:ParB-like chromosome segregation protein Spo0J
MNPGVEKDYALDFLSVVRHVVTQMDGAAPAALSIDDMAKTYRHTVPTDLTRVRLHHKIGNDSDAVRFLVERAVAALGSQIAGDGDGGYRLTRPFDDLRYERRKLHRFVETNEKDQERALRAAYNDLTEDRPFYVTVTGARGAGKERGLRLHPLARAIPQISEKEFTELAADIRTHGVKIPVVVFDDQVLDGRHRVAAAAALGVPVRVETFQGDDAAARDHVISLNVKRRHLTMAQRGLIVQELFLPEAEARARKRAEEGRKRGAAVTNQDQSALGQKRPQASESTKAIEDAAQASQGLVKVNVLRDMAPVRHAPKTQERIRSGEIKTVVQARKEALRETGLDKVESERLPAVRTETAYRLLGRALEKVQSACASIEAGHIGAASVSGDQIVSRINEIRSHLDRAEVLTTSAPV